MRAYCLIYVLLVCFTGLSQKLFEKRNYLYAGVDLSQFTYIISEHKSAFNFGGALQYKPFNFLSFNSSFTYNNVYEQRKYWISNLKEYHSSGTSLKAGLDLSLGLNLKRPLHRAFIGYQSMLINYRETGLFEIENYWGSHFRPFDTGNKLTFASEIIFGLQFGSKRWLFRPQIYTIFIKDAGRVSYNNDVMEGYHSPFIPGFGFKRAGLNLILAFRLGNTK